MRDPYAISRLSLSLLVEALRKAVFVTLDDEGHKMKFTLILSLI